MPAGGPINKHHDFASLTPAALVDVVSNPKFVPTGDSAKAIRDRIAMFLSVDAKEAYDVATAFHRAARRQAAKDPLVMAYALRSRAEASIYIGRWRSANRDYDAAVDFAKEARSDELLGEILVGRVGAAAALGERSTAVRIGKQAQRLLEKTNNTVYLGKLFMNLGNVAYHAERYAEALASYSRALEVMDAAGVRDGSWVALLINSAVAHRNLLRISDALDLYVRAGDACDMLGLHRLKAQTCYNRASLERLRGNYRVALSLLDEADQIFGGQDALDMVAATKRRLAEIHLELGLPGDAAALAAEAAEAFDAENMQLDAVLCHLREASALLEQSRADVALPLLHDVERFFSAERIWPRRALVRLEIARALLATGKPDHALNLAKKARQYFLRSGMTRAVFDANGLVARAFCELGKPHLAHRVIRAAPDPNVLPAGARAQWWALVGRIALLRGRTGEGIESLRQAVSYLEAQRRLIPGLGFRASSFDVHFEIYEELISLLLAERPLPVHELFSVVESARGRSFTDWQRLPAGEHDLITEDRARLGWLTLRVDELEQDGRAIAEQPFLKEIEKLEYQIARRVRKLDPREAPDVSSEASPTIRGTDEHPLLAYFAVGEDIIALVNRGDNRNVRALEVSVNEIRTSLKAMWFQFEEFSLAIGRDSANLDFMKRRTDRTLQTFYEQLLAPVEDLLPKTGRLTVLPHKELHNVPFECLFNGKHYVDHQWIVSRATTSLHVSSSSPNTSGASLICGMIGSGPAFVNREIAAVSRRLSSIPVRILEDPTTASLLEEMRDASLIHLSTHGYFREDNPVFSRLTTGDGALFVADLLGQHLSADLVVLAACNSGRVFTGRGDDMAGMAHAFLAAGARQLVASRWRVHDEATLELVGYFYDGLSEGLDAGQALANAGRRLRVERNHPFLWGAFTAHTR